MRRRTVNPVTLRVSATPVAFRMKSTRDAEMLKSGGVPVLIKHTEDTTNGDLVSAPAV